MTHGVDFVGRVTVSGRVVLGQRVESGRVESFKLDSWPFMHGLCTDNVPGLNLVASDAMTEEARVLRCPLCFRFMLGAFSVHADDITFTDVDMNISFSGAKRRRSSARPFHCA